MGCFSSSQLTSISPNCPNLLLLISHHLSKLRLWGQLLDKPAGSVPLSPLGHTCGGSMPLYPCPFVPPYLWPLFTLLSLLKGPVLEEGKEKLKSLLPSVPPQPGLPALSHAARERSSGGSWRSTQGGRPSPGHSGGGVLRVSRESTLRSNDTSVDKSHTSHRLVHPHWPRQTGKCFCVCESGRVRAALGWSRPSSPGTRSKRLHLRAAMAAGAGKGVGFCLEEEKLTI